MRKLIIAIDGPAGAGKSTVAKAVAARLGLGYLDTGAMYRALALNALRSGLSKEDGSGAASLGASLAIEFRPGDPQRVLMNGEDVTEAIRTQEIAEAASALSAFSEVRQLLVARQKAMLVDGGFTLEGRDATTVIAPDAELKLYLTAPLGERAKRRALELEAKGSPAAVKDIEKDVAQRDHRDTTRADSPLSIAPDAVVIDSGSMTAEQVIERVLELAKEAART